MPSIQPLALLLLLTACASPGSGPAAERLAPNTLAAAPGARVRTAAFVVTDGVYNSELVAPYDVLHHTVYRDDMDYIAPFVVSPDGDR